MDKAEKRFQSFEQILPEDTQYIVKLIQLGRREQAYAEFYKLLLQCQVVLVTDPIQLAQSIFQKARAA
jgi:hypothetical protein